jgi:hypothetical protein
VLLDKGRPAGISKWIQFDNIHKVDLALLAIGTSLLVNCLSMALFREKVALTPSSGGRCTHCQSWH